MRSFWRTLAAAACLTNCLLLAARFNQAIVLGLDKGDVPRAKEVLAVLKKEHPEIPSLDKLGQALEERAKGSK